MPDTMLPVETAAPSGAGILEGYRSSTIGALVLARAKATAEIKKVIKDKSAKVESRKDGRSYSYPYADLADVMAAVEDALAGQEMALFQTMQDRRNGVVLVTTLAHSSGEWIASEVRVSSLDGGPQVFGSSLTYMRRYSALAVLGIAPDTDDDGKAAQDRADQQARQKPPQRVQAPARAETAPKAPQAAQAAPQAPDGAPARSLAPVVMPLDPNADRDTVRAWYEAAVEELTDRDIGWVDRWIDLHAQQLRIIDQVRPGCSSQLAHWATTQHDRDAE